MGIPLGYEPRAFERIDGLITTHWSTLLPPKYPQRFHMPSLSTQSSQIDLSGKSNAHIPYLDVFDFCAPTCEHTRRNYCIWDSIVMGPPTKRIGDVP